MPRPEKTSTPEKKTKNKKWFDIECNNLKKQVRQIGIGKHKKPHHMTRF